MHITTRLAAPPHPEEDVALKTMDDKTSERPRLARIALAVAGILGAAGNAGAFQIETDNPDVAMRLDTQVRYNLGVRVEEQNSDFLNAPNFDESDGKFATLLKWISRLRRESLGGRCKPRQCPPTSAACLR
jgi:hypothetical protein